MVRCISENKALWEDMAKADGRSLNSWVERTLNLACLPPSSPLRDMAREARGQHNRGETTPLELMTAERPLSEMAAEALKADREGKTVPLEALCAEATLEEAVSRLVVTRKETPFERKPVGRIAKMLEKGKKTMEEAE